MPARNVNAHSHLSLHTHACTEVRAPREVKTDRQDKSGSKNRGAAKKGGGGGKGTWGKPGDEMTETPIDPSDPIYDAAEDDPYVLVSRHETEAGVAAKLGVPTESGAGAGAGYASSPPRDSYMRSRAGGASDGGMTLPEFKARIKPIIEEMFDSEDMAEVARSVGEMGAPAYHWELVKRAMTSAMDKRERERELASRMISELYGKVLSVDQVGKGFERAFELADDLKLDIPDVHKFVAQFLARAVADEVLPPSFLGDAEVERLGGDIIKQARTLLSMKHGTARLEKVWGPGSAQAPVEELKVSIDMIIQELFLSNDLAEALRCVRELAVPHFHHEVVKRAIVHGIDHNDRERALASALFKDLNAAEILSQDQAARGFARVKEALPDLSLDTPAAPSVYDGFVERALADGVIAEAPATPKPAEGEAEATTA